MPDPVRAERLRRHYQRHPEDYAEDILGLTWTEQQIDIAQRFAQNFARLFIKASHSVGKSFVTAGLINWHFDTVVPSITISTAPTRNHVERVLWKEVRKQRKHGASALQPKAPAMFATQDHYAIGITAAKPEAFQGQHEKSVMLAYDEAVGIHGDFWLAGEGMMTGEEARWIAIMNPTDPSSAAYQVQEAGNWDILTISALDHPNIKAALEGRKDPFPGAVTLSWVEDRVEKWCTPISSGDKQPGDVEWPPGSGCWHRPGPEFESRVLGRWPSQGLNSVWTEAVWESCLTPSEPKAMPLELACDVARFGDDWTTIGGRRGARVIHAERHNGWRVDQTADQLMYLAKDLAEPGEDPKKVLIKVDDTGVGGGVTDILTGQGYNSAGINASSTAIEAEMYPNRRSELWFTVRDLAAEGLVDLSALDKKTQQTMRRQALAVRYRMDKSGRRVVEEKDELKKRLKGANPNLEGGSPDDMDMLNLLFAVPTGGWAKDPHTLAFLVGRAQGNR